MTLLARLSSGNRVLLGAGAGAIAVAAIGMAIGRSPLLSGMFAVVGATLIGVSTFAPGALTVAADNATGTAAATEVVVADEVPERRATHRAPKKLLSAVSLVLLLGFSILVLALVFVAFCVTTFLILSGH
jgi:hypothetical protein